MLNVTCQLKGWTRLMDGLTWTLHMQDLVKAVGVSNYGPRQLERIHRFLTERGVPLASAQVSCCAVTLVTILGN